MENKGKYLAFTEKNTTVNGEGGLSTGVSYLKELGVNYVQLLPVFDYVNDETDESNLSYDWGYSPLNYQVPEGLYTTNPYDGNVRIREFKQMVQSLHEEQIGIVMDVVFNHVGGDAYTSWFKYMVPGYYFRQDKKGKIADSGTDCGNETASEREMFRKYMIDTVVYWASEYHIDGFRFDLMGCHDVETMNQIREALDKLPGGEKILIFELSLPDDDSVYTLKKVLEDLNFSSLLACYSSKGRSGYNPIMMYSLVTYANMRGVRDVDRIVELCERDLAFIWLAKGEKPKRDAFYDFKGEKLTGEVLDDLNYQFMCCLEKEGLEFWKNIEKRSAMSLRK